jgi:hypothetical protein
VRRSKAVNIAGEERPGVELLHVAAFPEQVEHDDAGLGQVRRAGHVGDDPARPGRVQRRPEQVALQVDERPDVRGLAAPAGLGPAAQCPETGARRVDEHPVERARAPRRHQAVPDHHLGVRADCSGH